MSTYRRRRDARDEPPGRGPDAAPDPVVLERRQTPRGELALRRRDGHHEIVAGGVFLMSTASGGVSERLLVRATLAAAAGAPARVLLGGLGVGFSLLEALRDERVAAVTVVEVEPSVVDWHGTHLRDITRGALDDPRVRVVCADLADVLAGTRGGDGPWDAVCLDTDNGPGWTVSPANEALYSARGVARLRAATAPGGAAGVWSAHAAPDFAARLEGAFSRVDVHTVEVPRGEPDHVYVARR